MYPVEEEEKTREEIAAEREQDKEYARLVKRQEDELKAACKVIDDAALEAPKVSYPDVWDKISVSWGEDLEHRMQSYVQTVTEAKPLPEELKGIKSKVAPAMEKAARLRKEADEAQLEADELAGRAHNLPIFIRVAAKGIEESRNSVLSWKSDCQRALDSLRRVG
jgi:hypothetical protein